MEAGASVDKPAIATDPDGVEVVVHMKAGARDFWIEGGDGSRQRHSVADGKHTFRERLQVVPGSGTVVCGPRELAANTAPIEIVDPSGIWHDERLACGDDYEEGSADPPLWFHKDVNPFPDAIRRVVPGIADTDRIEYAGYPPSGSRQGEYRVVRGDDVVAWFELEDYGDRTYVGATFVCPDSGIGAEGAGVAGRLATPYELPGKQRCDPYRTSCRVVSMSAARYQQLTDDVVFLEAESPQMACLEDQPEGCTPEPEDAIIEILVPAGGS